MPFTQSKLVKYIKDLGLNYKETSISFIFNCPCCGGKQKLYLRKEDGRFICFRCKEENGMSGKAEYALVELTDLPIKEIKSVLYGDGLVKSANYLDLQLTDFWTESEEEPLTDIEVPPKEMQWPYWAIDIRSKGAKLGADYLNSRGVSADLAGLYNVRYSALNRAVMFPVLSNNKLYGWQYRKIDKTRYIANNRIIETNKAWSSKDLPKNKMLMFADRLIDSQHAVITEGPMDAIKADKFGGNVASMGKEIGIAQVATILRHGIKKVYCGLDPDAFAEIDPLMKKLGNDVNVFRVNIPIRKGVKDLGDLSFDEAYQVINSAEPIVGGKLYIWMKPLEVF